MGRLTAPRSGRRGPRSPRGRPRRGRRARSRLVPRFKPVAERLRRLPRARPRRPPVEKFDLIIATLNFSGGAGLLAVLLAVICRCRRIRRRCNGRDARPGVIQITPLQPTLRQPCLALHCLVRRGKWRFRAVVDSCDHRRDTNDVSQREARIALVRTRGPAAVRLCHVAPEPGLHLVATR